MKPYIISYQTLKEIIIEYRKLLLALMVVVLAVFFLLAYLLPKQYTSNVMIQVKPQNSTLSALSNSSALLSLVGISTGVPGLS